VFRPICSAAVTVVALRQAAPRSALSTAATIPAKRINLNSPRMPHPISEKFPILTSKHQRIITSKIFQPGLNGETLEHPWMHDATIVVLKFSGRILDVRPTNDEDLAALARSNPSAGCDESKADVLDLRGFTILPGFIDTHVHRK